MERAPSATPLVDASVDGGVAHLVLNDPPLNILTQALLAEIRDALVVLAADHSVRVLVVRANSKHFSAGASVEEHLPGQVDEMIPEFIATVRALEDFPVPVVAAVHGRCLGGAFELALAADMVVAAESALLGVPEISLGVFPPAACVQLPQRVPPGVAAELLFTGAPLTAPAAKDAGLVLRVAADDELLSVADRLAAGIAHHSAAALRETKKALRAASGSLDAAYEAATRSYLQDLMQTSDAVEGLQAFMEKRPPEWRHA